MLRFRVLDDEEHLAWSYESKLLAGKRFDGRGLFEQTTRLFTKLSVFRSQPLDGSGEFPVLPPRAHGLEQTFLTYQRVEHQDERHEDQQQVKPFTAARERRWRGLIPASGERFPL